MAVDPTTDYRQQLAELRADIDRMQASIMADLQKAFDRSIAEINLVKKEECFTTFENPDESMDVLMRINTDDI